MLAASSSSLRLLRQTSGSHSGSPSCTPPPPPPDSKSSHFNLKARKAKLRARLEEIKREQRANWTQRHSKIIKFDITMNKLRKAYSPKHAVPPEIGEAELNEYKRFKSSRQDLELRAHDNGLIAYRFRLCGNTQFTQKARILEKSTRQLSDSRSKNEGGGPQVRGDHKAIDLQITRHMQADPYIHSDFEPAAAEEFLKQNKPVFDHMAFMAGALLPRFFIDYQLYPTGVERERLGGLWTSCTIDVFGDGGKGCKPHEHVGDPYAYACLAAYGKYKRGAVILPDVKAIIELAPGEALLFSESIWHLNEDFEGERMSMVCYTCKTMVSDGL
jgi:hypothetical protein